MKFRSNARFLEMRDSLGRKIHLDVRSSAFDFPLDFRSLGLDLRCLSFKMMTWKLPILINV